jgi:hypothetical protein
MVRSHRPALHVILAQAGIPLLCSLNEKEEAGFLLSQE